MGLWDMFGQFYQRPFNTYSLLGMALFGRDMEVHLPSGTSGKQSQDLQTGYLACMCVKTFQY